MVKAPVLKLMNRSAMGEKHTALRASYSNDAIQYELGVSASHFRTLICNFMMTKGKGDLIMKQMRKLSKSRLKMI